MDDDKRTIGGLFDWCYPDPLNPDPVFAIWTPKNETMHLLNDQVLRNACDRDGVGHAVLESFDSVDDSDGVPCAVGPACPEPNCWPYVLPGGPPS